MAVHVVIIGHIRHLGDTGHREWYTAYALWGTCYVCQTLCEMLVMCIISMDTLHSSYCYLCYILIGTLSFREANQFA